MNVADVVDPIHNYILEYSLDWWRRQPLSRITKQRSIPRGAFGQLQWKGAKFDVLKGILSVPVNSAEDFGQYDDDPNYRPQETEVWGLRKLKTFRGMYITSIQWVDFSRVLTAWLAPYGTRTEFSNRKITKLDMTHKLLYDMDVRFECNCPSWYWQGMAWRLSQLRPPAAIVRTNIRSKKWIPKHAEAGSYLPVCKHIYAVLSDMGDPEKYLYGLITRSLKRKMPDMYDELIARHPEYARYR